MLHKQEKDNKAKEENTKNIENTEESAETDMVAQMLVCAGHQLYFYTNSDRNNKENRMEIDFLTAKRTITNRHNMTPIEVKSGQRYTLTSIKKFMTKYKMQLDRPIVLHSGDLSEKDDILFLPLFMAMCL